MKNSRIEITVGAFVLLGLLAVAYLALRIGGGALIGSDTYPVLARFNNAAGVNSGANVSISGVVVGRVESVSLNFDDFSAVVKMNIRKDVRLATDTIVSVKTSGLIGDKFLAISPGMDDTIVEPGGLLTETESTVDIESLISRFAFGSVQKTEEK